MDQESRWYSTFIRLDQNKNHPSAGGYSLGQSGAGGYSFGQSGAGGYSLGQSGAGGYSLGQSGGVRWRRCTAVWSSL